MLEVIRTSSQSWWVRGIFVLLIATFIVWGIGSSFFTNPTAVATVNGYAITQEQFLRRLQQEKTSILQENPGITDSMLEQMGIRRQVLNNLIFRHLLLTQAESIGLFISNTLLRNTIMSLPLFKNQEGKFDYDAYNSMVKNNKTAILFFEEEVRNDLLIQKLMDLIRNSSYISEKTAQAMYAFLNEERSIEYVVIPASQYLDSVEISEKEKVDFYTTNKATWEQPHRIKLEYIPITTQSIIDSLKIPSARITEYYEAHKEQYKDMTTQEARKAIALYLKEQQVPQRKEDIIEKIQALRMEGKSFADIAKAVHLPLEEVNALPLDEMEERIGLPPASLTPYSTTPNNTIIIDPLPLADKSDVVFINVVENIPQSTPLLEEIEADVEYALRTEKALVKAREEAERIQHSGKLPNKTTTSSLFPRFNPPFELPIRSEEFIQDLFSASHNAFLKNVYTTTQGVVVAKVQEIFPAPQVEWEQAKNSFIRQVQNVQGDILFRAFQNYLYKQSNIAILNQAILQPMNTE